MVSVRQGWDLDSRVHQDRLIQMVQAQQIEVLILDPIRSVTATTDQAFSELRPFVQFLRRLVRETGVQLLLTHHDTKQRTTGTDKRRHPQRMSGGGLFSIVDAPIHLEKLPGDGSASLLVPSDYKFSTTPPPVRLHLTTDDPKVATWARLRAAVVAAGSVLNLEQDDKVLAYLREHRGQEFSGRQLKEELNMGQATVGASLNRLFAANLVEQRRGSGAEHNALLWRAANTVGLPAPSATSSRSRRR